jgi:hypothetical protein
MNLGITLVSYKMTVSYSPVCTSLACIVNCVKHEKMIFNGNNTMEKIMLNIFGPSYAMGNVGAL